MFRRFEGLVDPFVPYAAATLPPEAWRFVLSHLAPYRRIVAVSLALSAMIAVTEVWIITYAARLVDLLAGAAQETLWADSGLEFLVVALLVLVALPALKFLREALHDVGFRPNLVGQIRWRAHRHVLAQSVGWFQSDFAGRLAARVRDSGISGAGVVYTCIHTLAMVIAYLVASTAYLLTVDQRLAVPLLVWIALYLALMVWTVPRFRAANEAFQKALSAQTGMMVDSYTNIETIKMFAPGSEDDPETRALFETTRQTFFKVQRLEVTINVGMAALGSLLMVALVGYSIVLWQQNAAPLGLVAAALALSVRIAAMAEWMLDAVSALFGWLGSLRDSLSSIAQPLAISDAADAVALPKARGTIVFDRVSHHYGKGNGGLHRVSLRIDPGTRVGLVGPSGAGKSTLVRLLQRFFDAEDGTITVDGHDILAVKQDSLRRQIGVVAQEPALLHRSVRDNIAFGRTDVAEAEIVAAAKKAQAHDFIQGLRDASGRMGYEAHVGERGVTLSGGQRQRIALARAFLKDAPILILDEATSALDSEVEATIQEGLDTVMAGKTVIAIAHRLSTIARLDRIVVLDKGRIVEDGNHDELLGLGGLYARLWQRQSGGFIGTSVD